MQECMKDFYFFCHCVDVHMAGNVFHNNSRANAVSSQSFMCIYCTICNGYTHMVMGFENVLVIYIYVCTGLVLPDIAFLCLFHERKVTFDKDCFCHLTKESTVSSRNFSLERSPFVYASDCSECSKLQEPN